MERLPGVGALWLGGSLILLIAGSCPDASIGWQRELDGTGPGRHDEIAYTVTVDGAGDVIAGGYLWNRRSYDDFTVVKLAGATGIEFWRQEIDGTGSRLGSEMVVDVAVDRAGDVLAAGRVLNDGHGHDFTVVKLDGPSGHERWRRMIDGTWSDDDSALAVAVDGASDVVAVGWLGNRGSSDDFTVVKLAGESGAELWRWQVGGTQGSEDRALAVAIDANGDVVAAGFLVNACAFADFFVVKLAGATGGELWRHEIDGTAPYDPEQWVRWENMDDAAQAVAVDGAGDVVVGGYVRNAEGFEGIVLKLAGRTGAERWRTALDGADVALAVDGADDVIAGGIGSRMVKLSGATGEELWRQQASGNVAVDGAGDVIAVSGRQAKKLAGATGAELWHEEIGGNSGYAVAVDDTGHVIAAGSVLNPGLNEDFMVLKLNGADGSQFALAPVSCPPSPDSGCDGGFRRARLVVDERSRGRERLTMKWLKGPRLAGSDFGNPLFLDGTAYTLCLYDAEGRLVHGYVVAQAGARCGAKRCWEPVGKVPPSRRHRGYRYRDPAAAAGGLRKLDLIGGRANASKVRVAGSNNRATGRSSLPTGIAAALRESTGGVTIQLFSNQVPVGCLSETLRTVVDSGGALYRVKKR